MALDTLTSLAQEDEETLYEIREEAPKEIRKEPLKFAERRDFTTKELEQRVGKLVVDLYNTLGDEVTPNIIGKPRNGELPIVAVNSKGMVLFPESGSLLLPPDIDPRVVEMILKQPISSILDIEKGDWVFVKIEKPEQDSSYSPQIDTEDDSLLSIRNIREKAPMGTGENTDEKEIAKMYTQVMRYISGAIPNSAEVTELEIGPKKERVRVEKNSRGETILVNVKGEKIDLRKYPDDIKSLYQSYFQGPASGEEELGINLVSASIRPEKDFEPLEAQITSDPDREKQLAVNAAQRQHSLFMELVGPLKAINNLAQSEQSHLHIKIEKPERLPEKLDRYKIRPLIIGIGGKVTVFQDVREGNTILCLKGSDKSWYALRMERTPSDILEKKLRELEINN